MLHVEKLKEALLKGSIWQHSVLICHTEDGVTDKKIKEGQCDIQVIGGIRFIFFTFLQFFAMVAEPMS